MSQSQMATVPDRLSIASQVETWCQTMVITLRLGPLVYMASQKCYMFQCGPLD